MVNRILVYLKKKRSIPLDEITGADQLKFSVRYKLEVFIY